MFRFQGNTTDSNIVHQILQGMTAAGLEGLIVFFNPGRFKPQARDKTLNVRVVSRGATMDAMAASPVFRELLKEYVQGEVPSDGKKPRQRCAYGARPVAPERYIAPLVRGI